jgi:hypothetical protein
VQLCTYAVLEFKGGGKEGAVNLGGWFYYYLILVKKRISLATVVHTVVVE